MHRKQNELAKRAYAYYHHRDSRAAWELQAAESALAGADLEDRPVSRRTQTSAERQSPQSLAMPCEGREHPAGASATADRRSWQVGCRLAVANAEASIAWLLESSETRRCAGPNARAPSQAPTITSTDLSGRFGLYGCSCSITTKEAHPAKEELEGAAPLTGSRSQVHSSSA